jgi:hypothetical protein
MAFARHVLASSISNQGGHRYTPGDALFNYRALPAFCGIMVYPPGRARPLHRNMIAAQEVYSRNDARI